MGPGFESLCAHHKISLTNAVSLRNFSATRSLARSVAFSLPHENKKFPHEALREVWLFHYRAKTKNSHTKPCAKCGFFITARKQKFPHEAWRIVWLFYHTQKWLYMHKTVHIQPFYIISNKTMDYTLLFPCEFQNVTAVHQPCPFHQLYQFSVQQTLYFHAEPP